MTNPVSPKLDEDLPVYVLPKETHKTCVKCGVVVPIEETAGRYCRTCGNRRDLNNRQKQLEVLRNTLIRVAAGKIVAHTRGDRVDVVRLSQLASLIYEKLGGAEHVAQRFADLVTAATEHAILTKQGIRTAGDLYRALFSLTEAANARVDAAMDAVSLSDEEIQERITSLVAGKMLEAIPVHSEPVEYDDGADDG